MDTKSTDVHDDGPEGLTSRLAPFCSEVSLVLRYTGRLLDSAFRN